MRTFQKRVLSKCSISEATVQVVSKTDSCNDTTTNCFGPVTGPQLSASRVTLPLQKKIARCARTHGNRHVFTYMYAHKTLFI